MSLLDDLKADLLRDEGNPTKNGLSYAYQDHLGYWTIGPGILIDKAKGGGLRQEEVDFIRDNRVGLLSKDLNARLPMFRLYPEIVRRALMNMAYQLGVDGILKFQNMLAALDREDYQAAATHALDSLWARQTPARAERVAALIREG